MTERHEIIHSTKHGKVVCYPDREVQPYTVWHRGYVAYFSYSQEEAVETLENLERTG